MEYLPFTPTKAESFRLFFHTHNHDGVSASGASNTIYISKDNGAQIASSNSVVSVGKGIKYIDLTADEMNANVITIANENDSVLNNGIEDGYIIYTTGATGLDTPGGDGAGDVGVANFSPDFLDFLVSSINLNYFFRKVDFNSNIYNYYGMAKTSAIWTIVRENKASLVLEYATRKIGVNDKRFIQAWYQRTAITYTESSPF